MRVLWFTNIPLPAVSRHLGNSTWQLGGWMDELRKALGVYTDLQLGVASISVEDYAPFEEDHVRYFNILPPKSPGYLPGRIEGSWRRWQHVLNFPGFLDQCVKITRDFQPNVIHVHGTEGGFGLINGETEIPVIISLQGILSILSKVYFKGMSRGDIIREMFTEEFVEGRGFIHTYINMRKAAQREEQIVQQVKYFVGRTEWDLGYVALQNPAAAYYHGNEILRAAFYESRWKSESLARRVVYCTSGSSPYKGLECLIEAVAILKAAGYSYKLRIGGSVCGTEIWRWIERRMMKLELESEITWLGSLDADEIVEELKIASVYVLPSHIENSPNSLAEAMLVGTPCIASRVGGVPSMINDGVEGILYPDGNANELAEKILEVTTNPELAIRLSENARATARIRHDRMHIAKQMLSIYNVVMRSVHA